MNIDDEIKNTAKRMRELAARIRWLREHRKALEPLPEGNWCGDTLDFDRLNHADVIRVVKTFGGKWSKDSNILADRSKPTINYTRKDSVAGVTVRCWGGSAPPSCRLVEVEEHVPELVIPAHTKKVLKMICTGDEPVAVAISRAVTNNNQPQT